MLTTDQALTALADPHFWTFTADHATATRRTVLPNSEIAVLLLRLTNLATDLARALTDAQAATHMSVPPTRSRT